MDANSECSGEIKGVDNDKSASPGVNDDISDDKSKEIKNEPSDIVENVQEEISGNIELTASSEAAEEPSETLSIEIPKTFSEVLPNRNHSDKEQISNASITVKEEPCSEEIDYGMPIAKTPVHTSFSESYESLQNINGIQNINTNNSALDKLASKSALDDFLDGMVTPVAPLVPRLRVKAELSLLKPPQPAAVQDNNDLGQGDVTTDTIAPPPPILSSNSSSDFVADGITTPRISLASINRLRVKSEFSLPSATEEHNEDPPEEFFNDLINTKNIGREAGEISPSVTDDASDNEIIPNDYFDDLLIDKLKEKIDEAQNNDLEVKYSDRLKELEALKYELKRIEEKKERKNHKKQRKSKKKSKKRSRSRSLSPHCKERKERNFNELPNPYYDRNKRSRLLPARKQQYSGANYVSRRASEENILRVDSGYRDIKTEFSANELDNFTQEMHLNSVEVEETILTPKQRKERAVKRATALLHYLRNKADDTSDILYEFPFVSTVRKLPASHSYVQQQIYENRSPLHTVNNVSYTFNSHTSRFKTEEWGLAALPPISAKLAKLVGCDAEFIHNKLKTIRIPAKLKKLEQEVKKEAEHEVEEELVETTSSLYSNAMTQTDDVQTDDGQRKDKGYDIGVQVKPDVFSISSQTLETQSPTKKDWYKNDDLPLMKLIKDLNENQLMAIHSFADLIKEQNTGSNAMEMYKIQMQIMDIYKMSQLPSALNSVAQPAIVNNYATATRPREQTNLCIQSVKGADGRQYIANDPRSKSGAYSQRNAYADVGASSSSSYYDQRYEPNAYAARPSTSKGYSQTYFSATSEHDVRYTSTSPPSRHHPYIAHSSQQSSPTTIKRYGRGGLRR